MRRRRHRIQREEQRGVRHNRVGEGEVLHQGDGGHDPEDGDGGPAPQDQGQGKRGHEPGVGGRCSVSTNRPTPTTKSPTARTVSTTKA